MGSALKEFLKNVTAARNERTADHNALLRRLKAMTTDEFTHVSREVLDELTDEEYEEVVKWIAPDHKPRVAPETAPKRRRSPRNLLNAIPTSVQALVAAMATGLSTLAATLLVMPAIHWWQYQTPPVRSVDAGIWPHCARLNQWVDGCTYLPKRPMAWGEAAGLLGIAESDLRQTNQHIHRNHIPAGSILIVWRSRGILQGTNK